MKANELRIGNLVDFVIKGSVSTIEAIDRELVLTMLLGGIEFNAERSVNDLLPIPLTGKWLLKFGFKEHLYLSGNKYFTLGIESDYGSELTASTNEELIWSVYLTDCDGGNIGKENKYVHQLQNLYFSLTGEELNPLKD